MDSLSPPFLFCLVDIYHVPLPANYLSAFSLCLHVPLLADYFSVFSLCLDYCVLDAFSVGWMFMVPLYC